MDAVFQKLLRGHQILITDGRMDGRTHARTGVTLNAPPPFFEWRGIKSPFALESLQNQWGIFLPTLICKKFFTLDIF